MVLISVLRKSLLVSGPLTRVEMKAMTQVQWPLLTKSFSTSQKAPKNARYKLLGDNNMEQQLEAAAIPSDVLYEYHRKTYFTMISSASILQVAFWSWFKGAEAAIPITSVDVPDTTLMSVITNDAWSSIGLGASVMMAGIVRFFARRSIARVSLIAGGAKLRITTHKFLGGLNEPEDFALPQIRVSSQNDKYLTLKINDEIGFYLIDVNGTFHNRNKLDHILKIASTLPPVKEEKKPSSFPIKTDLPRTDLRAKK
ncbi:hypothetical protein THRCLA_07729 [Thraustotheca clavata]|uniref:Transmembrane protein n=1 Tax=Thraustotheca clavata TaxID=74557 RepID=A0A1V9ZC71_9STRA|nr:hypothetical protein THRCLA_07729 [Thraustotheca clavata]